MSRFATPNRTRPTSVAKSPKAPPLNEPGFRYSKGIPLAGASMKGQHYVNDVIIDGMSTRSPTSPGRRRSNSTKDDATVSTHSTMKKYEKPQRQDRKNKVKSPTPVRSRSSSPNTNARDNINVNSEVISVMSESLSGTRRSRSVSPSRNSSNPRTPTNPLWGNQYSANATGSFSDTGSVSGRSLSSKTSQTASISAISTSSLFHSLSQQTPPSHGIHNLQLSQKAFRSVRKTCVRDAITQFLQAEDQQNFLGDADLEDYKTLSTSGGEEDHEKRAEELKAEYKRHEKILKMTDLLRNAILDEIQQYDNVDYDQLFFPTENLHMPVVNETREQLQRLLFQWKEQYISEAITTLDRSFVNWQNLHQKRVDNSKIYQQLIEKRNAKELARAKRKDQLTKLRDKATSLGINVKELLSRFPAHWFHKEQTNIVQDSVFLSPNSSSQPLTSIKISADGLLETMAEFRASSSSKSQNNNNQIPFGSSQRASNADDSQMNRKISWEENMLAHSSQYWDKTHDEDNEPELQQNPEPLQPYAQQTNSDDEEVIFVSTPAQEDPNRLSVNFDAIRLLSNDHVSTSTNVPPTIVSTTTAMTESESVSSSGGGGGVDAVEHSQRGISRAKMMSKYSRR